MDKIREQIDDLNSVNVIHGPLRSWPIARCEEFANTMEAMNKVVEAAEAMLAVKYKMMGSQQHLELEQALANLKGEGV